MRWWERPSSSAVSRRPRCRSSTSVHAAFAVDDCAALRVASARARCSLLARIAFCARAGNRTSSMSSIASASSIHKLSASRRRRRAWSSVLPYVWQPRIRGTRASQAPLSSRSKTARYLTGATFFRGTARDPARLREAFPAEDLDPREPELLSDTSRIELERAIRGDAFPRIRADEAAGAVRFLSLRDISV